jgi:competence protein ComEA
VGEGSYRGAIVWLLAAGVVAFGLWRLAGDGADAGGSPVRIERGPEAGGRAHGGAAADRAGRVYVHVAGAVRRPGLVRVAAGARVAVAVSRAGGPTRRADLTAVNLAAQLEDGQQVIVPVRGAAGAALAAGGSSLEPGSPGAPKLSLAIATAEQLDELDGIGPTLSERIVEYRTENGGFRSLEELREVEGIGEKRFESLREALQL